MASPSLAAMAIAARTDGATCAPKPGAPPLRDYQERAVNAAFSDWRFCRSTLYVCPTGGGKSFVFAKIAERFRPIGRTLILADRDTLVDQAANNVALLTDLTVGIERAGERVDASALPDVVCATIQSIRQARRLARFAPDAFGLVVVDEADLAVAPSYVEVLNHFPEAKVFGCTATPDRADGKSLGAIFESVADKVDIADLIDRGCLSRIRRQLVRIHSVDLSTSDIDKDGDFRDEQLGRILAEERPLHEVVKPTLDLAEKRPTLVFGATVAHAEALADLFNRYRRGSARVVHGKMARADRRSLARDFAAGKFQFLCNCALLLRGVDVPFVSCVAMARPTKSRALYCQALGRGTRIANEKPDLLVIDFTDNSQTHSLVSVVDILGGRESAEVREHAHSLLEQMPGADATDVIEEAKTQLMADPQLRAAVIARVEYRLQQISAHGIDWDKQPLGEMPDSALANLLGVTSAAVVFARARRGVHCFGKLSSDVDWEKQPLGAVADTALADSLGVSRSMVAAARAARGIPHLDTRRKIHWDEIPLGELPDAVLAELLGITASSVAGARWARGIEPARIQVVKRPPKANIDWDSVPLGADFDEVIANRLGVRKEVVWRNRRARGIPPFRQTHTTDKQLFPRKVS